MSNAAHTVAVLGATHKSDRYANQAIRRLRAQHFDVVPVSPRLQTCEGLPVTASLAGIRSQVHTLTLYVGPAKLEHMIKEIVALRPGRVIFNPGTECVPLQHALDRAGIPWEAACTLVLLSQGIFLDSVQETHHG